LPLREIPLDEVVFLRNRGHNSNERFRSIEKEWKYFPSKLGIYVSLF
jgi:hypothetical protein